ncbi:CHAT domain-containing protein [Streptomyces sp. NBRC 109706]|uniref:CHAT domain-containing protein n=1 Tax=Streptomyces sp. NBRC 109706 TaxID=1550035 RepID=UPI00078107FD|nr:CHAT domain-containing protein [Streptomyces sp. NBRC 109706]
MDAELKRALARADEMLPSMGLSADHDGALRPVGGASTDAQLDRTIDELALAEPKLPENSDDRPLVRARLGCLYGKRYLRGVGPAEDQAEGIRLLRAARAAAGAGRLVERERLRAALVLTTLLLPMPRPGPGGGIPGFDQVVDWGLRAERRSPQLRSEIAEADRLLAELEAARLPAPLPNEIARLRTVLRTVSSLAFLGDVPGLVGFGDQLLRDQPGLGKGGDMMRAALGMLRGLPALPPAPAKPKRPARPTESARPPAAVESEPPAEKTEMPRTPETPQKPESEAALAMEAAALSMLGEMTAPGLVGTERLSELIASLQSSPRAEADPAGANLDMVLAALGEATMAVRTGDSDLVDHAHELLGRFGKGLPEGHDLGMLVRAMQGALPSVTALTRGNLQDEAESMRRLAALAPEPIRDVDSVPGTGDVRRLTVMARAMLLTLRLGRISVNENERPAEVDEALAELRGLVEGIDERDEIFGPVVVQLVFAHLSRAAARRGVEDARAAIRLVEQLQENPAAPRVVHEMVGIVWPLAMAVCAVLERDPDRLLGVVESARPALEVATPSAANQLARSRAVLAEVLGVHHELTGDRRSLDEAIAELRRAREDLAEDTDNQAARLLLGSLARLHAKRGDVAAGDRRAAIEAGLAALQVTADDVLMQLGAEHGLEMARGGADQALRVAMWAVAEGDPAGAVRALEVGRALVLRAAAASVGVPEQLAALGREDLAEEWRRDVPPGAGGTPVDGGLSAALLAEAGTAGPVPSRLRRRALDALRPGREGRWTLLSVPELPKLVAGVEASGADALVYLVPGRAEEDGVALLVRRSGDGGAGGAGVLPLPGLSAAGRRPLDTYLQVAARRSAEPSPDADRAWEAALEDLCAWAGPAVVAPLLDRLTADGVGGAPTRVVLVPCGNLGVVPWHAARLASRYACQVAVFSYAASGAQFLDAAGRQRTPPGARPVLVADPRLDLAWASDEVTTLHTTYYQRATLYGEFVTEPGSVPRGAGTPEELLAVLPGASAGEPASLLHIASHGEAGARPTVSALALADQDGAAQDEGLLTVTRLLDRPGGVAAGEPGPLVVLSACETDLSRRDHDEALTLTTAFVARGATDAVGSRWTTRDSASALMMAVFHHQLTVVGLAPADALRETQLWMLDPARRPPPGVEGELAREARQPFLDRVPIWAAFIHQGNPRPAGVAGLGGSGEERE